MKKFILFCAAIIVLYGMVMQIRAQDTPISVSAYVPANPSDFSFSFEPVTTDTTVNQDTSIEYKISYSSNSSLTSNAPVTITASWAPGTIDSPSPSQVDILDYDLNSASTGYGGAPPVVDIVNQKITWKIPSFPPQTTAAVTFRLKTNHSYTGQYPVNFTVSAVMGSDPFELPTQTITKQYQYLNIPPTGTPIPTPTTNIQATPTPEPGSEDNTETVTPTPTPTSEPTENTGTSLQFTNIFLQELSSNSLILAVGTSTETSLKVLYGTDLRSLDNSISLAGAAKDHVVSLDNLAEDTTYYVKIIAKDKDGNTITSTLYEFKTSVLSEIPTLRKNSLSVTSLNSILIDPSLTGSSAAVLVIPKRQSFEVKFAIDKSTDIKRVTIYIRSKSVLGINSFLIGQFTEDSASNDVVELSPGVFIGRLSSPQDIGQYEIIVRIRTKGGSLVEEKLTDMKLTEGFRVTNEKTGKAIEGAQIIMYYLNPRTHKYEILPSQIFPIKNPEYTDIRGEISLALPQGNYQAVINGIGYSQARVPFVIGTADNESYPHIKLHEDPFSFVTLVSYYWTTFADVANTSKIYIQGLSNSTRFFELNALVATTILVMLTLLTFSSRLHVPLHSLSDYLWHHSQIASVRKKLGQKIKGRIFDETTSAALAGAHVFLVNIETRKVVAYTETDKNGDFTMIKSKNDLYDISVLKEGYEEVIFRESEIDSVGIGGYLLAIKKRQTDLTLLERLTAYSGKIVSLLFEVMIVSSLLFEISLGYALGWTLVFPFLVFSILNLGLWLLHLSHLRSERNLF